jgi:hypothetical protein
VKAPVDETRRARIRQAVEEVLARKNLSINAASVRFGISRVSMTKLASGWPLSLDLLEHFARALGEDPNKWREICGYPPADASVPPSQPLPELAEQLAPFIRAIVIEELEKRRG